MFEKRVIIDPEIRHGKPIIKGTRVPIEVISGSLAGGMQIKDIAKYYGIKKEDVRDIGMRAAKDKELRDVLIFPGIGN